MEARAAGVQKEKLPSNRGGEGRHYDRHVQVRKKGRDVRLRPSSPEGNQTLTPTTH